MKRAQRGGRPGGRGKKEAGWAAVGWAGWAAAGWAAGWAADEAAMGWAAVGWVAALKYPGGKFNASR